MNIPNVEEVEVTTDPMQMIIVHVNRHIRALNTCDNLPIKGAREDMAIRYEEVSHVTCSNASRSAAMLD
jgi:hypothetical protein